MHKIEANSSKNYLHIHLEGFVDSDELDQAVRTIHQEVKKLSKGFTIINDISGCKVIKISDTEKVKETQKWLYQQGAKKTIRIVDNVFAQAQFRKTQQSGQALYETTEVASLAQALGSL